MTGCHPAGAGALQDAGGAPHGAGAGAGQWSSYRHWEYHSLQWMHFNPGQHPLLASGPAYLPPQVSYSFWHVFAGADQEAGADQDEGAALGADQDALGADQDALGADQDEGAGHGAAACGTTTR